MNSTTMFKPRSTRKLLEILLEESILTYDALGSAHEAKAGYRPRQWSAIETSERPGLSTCRLQASSLRTFHDVPIITTVS